MKRNLISLVLVGLLFCGFTSCNNAEAINDTTTNVQSEEVQKVVESDPTILEPATNAADIVADQSASAEGTGKVRKITTATFIAEIFDYKANPTKWVYKGDKPAIIDFYADWCGPCKRVAPIMDELALKYKGQVNFYKINTDEEKELSGSVFGIRSIPSILYIPVNGQPSMSQGASPKETYIQQIDALLKK